MTTKRDLIQRLTERRLLEHVVLIAEAHDCLDQPEPEGPTEEEINELFWKHSSEIGPSVGVGLAHEDAPALICEALARWGRPATPTETP